MKTKTLILIVSVFSLLYLSSCEEVFSGVSRAENSFPTKESKLSVDMPREINIKGVSESREIYWAVVEELRSRDFVVTEKSAPVTLKINIRTVGCKIICTAKIINNAGQIMSQGQGEQFFWRSYDDFSREDKLKKQIKAAVQAVRSATS